MQESAPRSRGLRAAPQAAAGARRSMEISLCPKALLERYKVLAEDVSAERDVLTRRLGALEVMNAEAHAARFRCLEQASEISRLSRDARAVSEQMSSGKLSVVNLLTTIERKDKELAEADARVQTLLSFIPERDVAMIFDGGETPPKVVDLGDDELDEVAAGARSPRHCSRPAIVARFPRRAPAGVAQLGDFDIRKQAASECQRPEATWPSRNAAPSRSPAIASRRRAARPAWDARGPNASSPGAPPPPPPAVEPWRAALDAVEGTVKARAAAESSFSETAQSFARRERHLLNELKRRDELLYSATRDVVDAKREALEARVRLSRGEAELAAAHARVSDACVALRAKYEAEACAGRAALAQEIRAATIEIRHERDAAKRDAADARARLAESESAHSERLADAKRDVATSRHTSPTSRSAARWNSRATAATSPSSASDSPRSRKGDRWESSVR